MIEVDLVIRGGQLVTGSTVASADIGIRDGVMTRTRNHAGSMMSRVVLPRLSQAA
jgi:hypothetical protein